MCQFKWINLSGSGEKEKASVVAGVTEQIADDHFYAMRSSRARADKIYGEIVKNYFLQLYLKGG